MAKSAKNKCRYFRLDKEIPEELKRFLTDEQLAILRCYLLNYNYTEMCAKVGVGRRKRADILDYLVDLGRGLALFRVLEMEITPTIPKNVGAKSFMRGWMACKRAIRKEVQNEKPRRKTVKARNS